MPSKKLPVFRVTALPPTSVIINPGFNFSWSDEIRQLIKRDQGDASAVPPATGSPAMGSPTTGSPATGPTASDSEFLAQDDFWNQMEFRSISKNLMYVELTGTVVRIGAQASASQFAAARDGVAGFVFKTRARPLNCVMHYSDPLQAKRAPVGNSHYRTLVWEKTKPSDGYVPARLVSSPAPGGGPVNGKGVSEDGTGWFYASPPDGSAGHAVSVPSGGTLSRLPGWTYDGPYRSAGGALGANSAAPGAGTGNGTPTSSSNLVVLITNRPWAETVKPVGSKKTCCAFRNVEPDLTVEAQTREELDANQQWQMELLWIGVAPGQQNRPRARVSWGDNEWSIVFAQDDHDTIIPALERRVKGQWKSVRRFEDARFPKFENTTTLLTVRRIARRLVVGFTTQGATHTFEVLLARKSKGKGGAVEYKATPFKWRAGKMVISSYGVRVRWGLDWLDHTDDKGNELEGGYSRQFARSTSEFDEDSVKSVGVGTLCDPDHFEFEWSKNPQKGTFDYTVKMKADKHESPFLIKCDGAYNAIIEATDEPGLDITAAFLGGDLDVASPESGASGSVLSLRFSRNVLRDLGHVLGIVWTDWLQQFRLVRFEVAWTLSDGTQSPWRNLGEYYVEDETYDNPEVNTFNLSVACHDPIMRLIAPHSLVDYRFLPDLTFLLAFKNGGQGGKLYGAECWQYILGIELGTAEAARLNGNGDPLRFYPDDHYPMISTDLDTVGYCYGANLTPTSQAKILPPPRYGCSAMEWGQKLAGDDFAMIFYAPPFHNPSDVNHETPTRPCPIYANYDEWVRFAPTWLVSDDTYDAGDLDFILSSLQFVRRGGTKFNAAQVWWNPPGVDTNSLPFPAVKMAEGTLGADDPNSPEYSWRRTHNVEDAQLYLPGAIETYVFQYLQGLAGIDIRWPTVVLPRGHAGLWWGHKIGIKSHNWDNNGKFSDPDMNLENIVFRAVRVKQSFNAERVGKEMFTSTLTLFPVLNGEPDGYAGVEI